MRTFLRIFFIFSYLLPAASALADTPKPESAKAAPAGYLFRVKSGDYKAQFPGAPKEEMKSTDTASGPVQTQLATYLDEAARRTFVTSEGQFSIDKSLVTDPEKILDGARDGVVASTGSKLLNELKIKKGGIPGREFAFVNPQGLGVLVRVFYNPQTNVLYQAIVTSEDGKTDFPEAKAFVNSFEILK
ncbi:MAG: hypothetical protein U1F57_03350 [bacterium]